MGIEVLWGFDQLVQEWFERRWGVGFRVLVGYRGGHYDCGNRRIVIEVQLNNFSCTVTRATANLPGTETPPDHHLPSAWSAASVDWNTWTTSTTLVLCLVDVAWPPSQSRR